MGILKSKLRIAFALLVGELALRVLGIVPPGFQPYPTTHVRGLFELRDDGSPISWLALALENTTSHCLLMTMKLSDMPSMVSLRLVLIASDLRRASTMSEMSCNAPLIPRTCFFSASHIGLPEMRTHFRTF